MTGPRGIFFYVVCAAVLVAAAVASCALRAKYSLVPQLKSTDAYMDATNLDRYSFLQYNQAGPERGQRALLKYLKLLERIKAEGIEYPQAILHRDFGLVYLRLSRVELLQGNSVAADNYMNSAEKEFSALGWKDVSVEALTEYIETLESNERRLYNGTGIHDSMVQPRSHAPKGSSE
jgi:hypothetical protein